MRIKIHNKNTPTSYVLFRTSERGFTLLELLVTMGVFAVVGVTVVTILVTTLREVNKTNVIASVRQNGDYALTTMSRNIREAASLQNPPPPCGVPSAPSSDTYIQAMAGDASTIKYQCTSNSITDVNGADIVDKNAVIVSGCNFYCSQDSPSQSPVIKVVFTLQANTTSNLPEKNTAPIQFQTSVVMRNVNR